MDTNTTNSSQLDPKAEDCFPAPLDSEIANISSIEDEMLIDELCKQFN